MSHHGNLLDLSALGAAQREPRLARLLIELTANLQQMAVALEAFDEEGRGRMNKMPQARVFSIPIPSRLLR
jgi:hypothetical protein